MANGTHASIQPSTFQQQLDIAEELGMKNIGTGSDPTSSAYKAEWDAAADIWNELGRQAAPGMRLYTHNHDAAYNFLIDRGPRDARASRPGRPASADWSTSSRSPTRGTSSSSSTSTGPTWPATSTRSTSTRLARRSPTCSTRSSPWPTGPPGSRSSTPRTATGTPQFPTATR
ncbi:hypothetical protein NKG94_41385 [Micromonospora sp. M12]